MNARIPVKHHTILPGINPANDKETITLKGLNGQVAVAAQY